MAGQGQTREDRALATSLKKSHTFQFLLSGELKRVVSLNCQDDRDLY